MGVFIMKKIKLTQGKFALVDDEDFEYLNKYKWFCLNKRYACTNKNVNKKRNAILMHRLIMNLTDRKIEVDHKDHNGLNNQKNNLRKCTHQENLKNRLACGKSKYLGVSVCANRYLGFIKSNNKTIYLGIHKTEMEAAKAYDAKAKELHGEFANLNFK